MSNKKDLDNEHQFFIDIYKLLDARREMAYRSVNTVMVKTYWQIGKRIVEQEQQNKARAEYGEQLIVKLSRYLTDSFGTGFSVATLKNIRQFYYIFPDLNELATQCVANLGWTHLRLIMRLDNAKERQYYLQEASSQNWSSRLLERNIRSGYYHRLLSSQNGSTDQQVDDSSAFIKDPYILEFLNVPMI